MKLKIRSLLLAGGLALTLVPASQSTAQTGSEQLNAHARLERSARLIDSQLSGKTGGMQRDDLRQRRREIDDAITRLQAGRKVDASEIDRILGEVSFERAK